MLNRSLEQGNGAVFDAWTSNSLTKMLNHLETPGHPVDVHYLLLCIVEEAYKKRADNQNMRDLCEVIAFKHLALFSSIAPLLIKKDFIPRVPTFQYLATILTEGGEYEKAIAVCDMALSYDLHDNTMSGFEGRIARIRKKMDSQISSEATSDFNKILLNDFQKGLQYKHNVKIKAKKIDEPVYGGKPKKATAENPGCTMIVVLIVLMFIILNFDKV